MSQMSQTSRTFKCKEIIQILKNSRSSGIAAAKYFMSSVQLIILIAICCTCDAFIVHRFSHGTGGFIAKCTRDRCFVRNSVFKAHVDNKLYRSKILSLRMTKEEQSCKYPFGRESTVLVVGASRGLGLEFVRQLLSKGSYVIATYRSSQPPKDLKTLEASSGGRLQLVVCDVASSDSIRAAAESMKGR